MSNSSHLPENCPYLGLHDDPGTSLAYPSAWNYCYRARPPVSVSIPHQMEACLKREHVDCPVYLAEQEGALPSSLRGSSTVPAKRHRKTRKSGSVVWIIILLVATLAGILLWQMGFLPLPSPPIPTPGLVAVSTDVPSPTATIRAAWTNPALAVTVKVRTPTRRASQTPQGTISPPASTSTLTRTPSRTPTSPPTQTAPPTLPPGTCGHALDVQFGTDYKFVIHRVVGGNTLDLFISKYETNLEAILAVNFSLHVPLWADEIIVIPVGRTDTRGIPPFATYQASGETISLDQLALQLSTDAQSLQKFNDFDETCTTFVNWLLVPRWR